MTAYADSYTIASGADLYAGMDPPVDPSAPPIQVALVGDSLTDQNLGNISPFHVWNGMLGGKLQLIANIGVYGNTIGQMLARIDNLYTDSSPGLAGLPPLGWIEFRGGTNDMRAGAISSGLQSTYDQLLTKMLTYAEKVIVKPVPPIGGAEAAANSRVPAYNAYLQSKCAASGGSLIWVDDCVNMKDGDGSALTQYYASDVVHFNTAGVWRLATDSAAALTSTIAAMNYASPVSTDPADKYSAQPQWNPNHVNAGTSGSVGNLAGTVPTGWGIWGYGSGITATASIVAADVGDSNQTPWLRITPSAVAYGSGGQEIQISATAAGRTITTVDPAALEAVVEWRLNSLDTSKFSKAYSWFQATGGGGGQLMPFLEAKFGGSGIVSKTLTMRQKLDRPTHNTATGAVLYHAVSISADGSGSLGSIDLRCSTVRG